MRVFVGVPLSKRLQKNVAAWQEAYEKAYSPKGIRWIKKKNLHITLLAPWQEKNVVEKVKLLQENPFPVSAFDLTFHKILFMPSKKSKYVWTAAETPKELLDLRNHLSERLGRTLEKRKFLLHATMARFQKNAEAVLIEEEIDWSMQVTSFALFASKLSPRGAEYEILATFPFLTFAKRCQVML